MTHAQAPSVEEQMLGRQAKIVSPATLRRMLAYARQARQPKRDTVIVLLSVKAGLRACEIAGLQWSMVMTDNGKIGDVIDIRDTIAKRGAGRRIPMHPDLQRALAELWRARTSDRYIVASNRGGPMRANSIVNWFVALFAPGSIGASMIQVALQAIHFCASSEIMGHQLSGYSAYWAIPFPKDQFSF
jgi:integrase